MHAAGSENYALCNMYLFGSKTFRVANAVGSAYISGSNNSFSFCIVQPYIQSEYMQLDCAVFKHYKYLIGGLYTKFIHVYDVSQITFGNGYQFKTHPKLSLGFQMEGSYFSIQHQENNFNVALKFSAVYQHSDKLKSAVLFGIPIPDRNKAILFCTALQYNISEKIIGLTEIELDHQFDPIIKLGINTQLNEEWGLLNAISLQKQTIGFGLKRSNKKFQYVLGINYHQNLGTGSSIEVQYVW